MAITTTQLTSTEIKARCREDYLSRNIRENIRNAYFCEDTDVILDQINNRLAQGKKFEASCLKELLDEAIQELFDTTK